MSDPLGQSSELDHVIDLLAETAKGYFPTLTEREVAGRTPMEALAALGGPLPEQGDGTSKALVRLIEASVDAATHSSGPRFFSFVVGGATPAALGGDWLASTLDQNVGMWLASPLGSGLEVIAIDWLKELFRLPAEWGGLLTSGATMANYTGLAAARRWWGGQHDIDVDEQGLAGGPQVPVFSSGYVHASAVKALGMLGIGRRNIELLNADDAGRLDVAGLRSRLTSLGGAPSIIIVNAGEVNTGDFDPMAPVVELARANNAWVHVDGAFGLFSRVSPRTLPLTEGIEGAHSVIADGHKWLNVPHDCGFVFVHDRSLLEGVFTSGAAYLVGGGDEQPNFAMLGPESSRRARAFTVWATLSAYGSEGYRQMVERHLDLTQRLAHAIDEAPELERLGDAPLNIVCFRLHPPGASDDQLDELNRHLAQAVLEDGRVYVGTTVYRGMVAFRPALVNWRMTEADIDLLVEVVREHAQRLAA